MFTLVNKTSIDAFLFDFWSNVIFVDILRMEYLEGLQTLVDPSALVNSNQLKRSI